MVQGQVFLKEGGEGWGWHYYYLIFSRFIIFTFFLHLESILLSAKLCYTFEEKVFFSANILF